MVRVLTLFLSLTMALPAQGVMIPFDIDPGDGYIPIFIDLDFGGEGTGSRRRSSGGSGYFAPGLGPSSTNFPLIDGHSSGRKTALPIDFQIAARRFVDGDTYPDQVGFRDNLIELASGLKANLLLRATTPELRHQTGYFDLYQKADSFLAPYRYPILHNREGDRLDMGDTYKSPGAVMILLGLKIADKAKELVEAESNELNRLTYDLAIRESRSLMFLASYSLQNYEGTEAQKQNLFEGLTKASLEGISEKVRSEVFKDIGTFKDRRVYQEAADNISVTEKDFERNEDTVNKRQAKAFKSLMTFYGFVGAIISAGLIEQAVLETHNISYVVNMILENYGEYVAWARRTGGFYSGFAALLSGIVIVPAAGAGIVAKFKNRTRRGPHQNIHHSASHTDAENFGRLFCRKALSL